MLPGTRCFIYEPLPIGRITGYFDFDGYIEDEPCKLWANYRHLMGIEAKEYFDYFKGCKLATAWLILNVEKYYAPCFLDEYDLERAPQSYCYIKRMIGR